MEPAQASPEPADAFIAQLYSKALVLPPARFRMWALEQLSGLIACDAALWGSGIAANLRFHTLTLFALPREFQNCLEATATINPLLPHMLNHLGQPTDMQSVLPDAEFHASELYQRAFAPFQIERIMATVRRDARSGLYTLITLYRRDRFAAFTQAEKDLQQRLCVHLIEAASHSFFMHLLRNTDPLDGRGSALVDRHGLYHEAQPVFHELLDTQFPDRGASLPFAVPEPGERLNLGKLCLSCKPMGDLFILQIWNAGPLDRLTAREHQIVMAVAQGLSFKQAARKIGVAPSTVANHLYRVYRKLGVSSRTELAKLVHPEA